MSSDEKGALGQEANSGDYIAIDYKALGAKIKSVRGSATQADFARQFGITRADVSKIERGEDRPTAELLYNICLRHHLSLEWMLSGHEPSSQPAQEELFKSHIVKSGPVTVREEPAEVIATPVLELTELVEWFRLHPEDLDSVTKMIQGKKIMLEALKEFEK
jgi:transcriptional regulator with XRE-family HTH domain